MNMYEDVINEIIECYREKVRPTHQGYESYLQNLYRDCNKICIFPAGQSGLELCEFINNKGYKVDFISDNNVDRIKALQNKNDKNSNIKYITVEELENFKDDTLVLISSIYHEEIYQGLKQRGFPYIQKIYERHFEVQRYFESLDWEYFRNSVVKLLKMVSDDISKNVIINTIKSWLLFDEEYNYWGEIYDKNQYFPEEIVRIGEREVFCDVGAYMGDSLNIILDKCNKKFKKIYLFELSYEIYSDLMDSVNNYEEKIREKVISYNLGLSDCEETISYEKKGSETSMSKEGTEIGKVVRMDDILKGEKVSYIKMDIEGAEYSALHGCEKIIIKQKPVLAICTYHIVDDLWRIPFYIKSLAPEYKIYFRHHSKSAIETVCYAVYDRV